MSELSFKISTQRQITFEIINGWLGLATRNFVKSLWTDWWPFKCLSYLNFNSLTSSSSHLIIKWTWKSTVSTVRIFFCYNVLFLYDSTELFSCVCLSHVRHCFALFFFLHFWFLPEVVSLKLKSNNNRYNVDDLLIAPKPACRAEMLQETKLGLSKAKKKLILMANSITHQSPK